MTEQQTIDVAVGGIDKEHPSSHGQRSLWVHERMRPGETTYTIAHAVRCRAGFEITKLKRAISSLVGRHEALRTVLFEQGGQVSQRIQHMVRVPFSHVDAVSLETEAFQAELAKFARQPFDLTTGPLLRVALYERPAGEHVMLVAVHHAVADLWSMGVLMKDLFLSTRRRRAAGRSACRHREASTVTTCGVRWTFSSPKASGRGDSGAISAPTGQGIPR